jgi:hypothetical protein
MSNFSQTDIVTAIVAPKHLRAGDSVTRPVAILFSDDLLENVAELKLSHRDAIELAHEILRLCKEIPE